MSTPGTRIEFVDRLRGLAVVCMFFVHSAVAWLRPEIKGTTYWVWSMRVSGMVAPVFMFLAGVAIAMIAEQGRAAGRDELSLKRRVSLRGLQILALGYGLHVAFFVFSGFAGSWLRIFKVDVLHCIGLTLAVIPWLMWPRRRLEWRAFAASIVILFAGQVTLLVPFGRWLPFGLAAWFSPDRAVSIFPPLPYAAWITMGVFVGAAWVPVAHDIAAERVFFKRLALAAIVLTLASYGLKALYYGLSLNRFEYTDNPTRTTIHFFVFKAALVLLIFAVARFAAAAPSRFRFRPFSVFGRRSLFAYCAHLLLIYHGAGPVFDLHKALTPGQQALGAAALTAIMTVLVLAVDRWRRAENRA
ncbi:MAG: heparan-alpha-glucosaminide N-acetyltransferase domain-containing protein [Deltaproteobacteria bacterium]|nr:heparan-alpha-glucosaminide N-acetyltransferase domain-containing protein [Deltaproteobacteria bacterium]